MVNEDIRLLQLNCANCGAALDMSTVHGVALNLVDCKYCGTEFKIDNNSLKRITAGMPVAQIKPEVKLTKQKVKVKGEGFGIGGALGGILAVIVAAVALIVGIFVIAQLQSSLTTPSIHTITNHGVTTTTTSNYGLYSFPQSAQTSINSVFNSVYNAYNLIVVVLIVLAAVAILATIIEGLGGGFSRRPIVIILLILLFNIFVIFGAGQYTHPTTSSPITTTNSNLPVRNNCSYYISQNHPSSTSFSGSDNYYYAQNCSTGAIAYGGPNNAGGVSGQNSFAVLQAVTKNPPINGTVIVEGVTICTPNSSSVLYINPSSAVHIIFENNIIVRAEC